jgi:hypothetical protein
MIRGKSVIGPIDRKVYETLRNRKKSSKLLTSFSFACPTGMKVCGKLTDIIDNYSTRNVFIAIPYSHYTHEKAIQSTLRAAKLRPLLAKDKIQTTDVLCKICSMMRKCAYLVADISTQNANVAYELGLTQSLGKDCAILFSGRSKSHKHKQSDLVGIEDVRYYSEKELKKRLGEWLEGNVKEANKASLKSFLKNL